MSGVEQTLTERYAGPPAWRRGVTLAGIVVLAVVCLGWLAWATFVQSTPKVESELQGFDVVDVHHATASIQVDIHDASSHPRCTVQALASDHSIVGELVFTPHNGVNEVTVRTEREATAVDAPGCIADGQNTPR
jgi:Domain of unknown function (DUF4307)